MKALFLDFDGVIVTWRSWATRQDWNKNSNPEDVTACKFLERLLHYSQHIPVKLVISSSWRFAEQQCKALLERNNLTQYLYAPEWCTTLYPDSGRHLDGRIVPSFSRGGEIADYLKRHPEITDYYILDDDSNGMNGGLAKHFLKTDEVNGISGQQMRTLVNWITPSSKRGTW